MYDILRKNSALSKEEFYQCCVENEAVDASLNKFSLLLHHSVQLRIQNTPAYCNECIKKQKECKHSKIAVLFSGGIDCTILALIANTYADPDDSIDLLNVAFEQVNKTDAVWAVPDRLTAKESLTELQHLCPKR